MSVQLIAPTVAATPGPTSIASQVPVLKDIIWERYVRALDIKRRLHVLRPFVAELDRVTRSKPFRFRNDIVWLEILDMRDKLVIDLYSLTVEMRHGVKPLDPNVPFRGSAKRKRGLFVEIRDHHLASLTRTYVRHPDDDDYEFRLYTKTKAEVFGRLFPSCTADSPTAAQVDELCERFRLRMVPLGDDRNKNRAHALEGDAGLARMHTVPDLAELFEYVEGLLEDLSLVSSGSAFGGDNMVHADCKETAADQVDMILLGNISDIRQLTMTRTRDQLYDQLHQIHDSSPATEDGDTRKLHFNDRQFGPPFWP